MSVNRSCLYLAYCVLGFSAGRKKKKQINVVVVSILCTLSVAES